MEFCARRLLLQLGLLESSFAGISLQLLSNFIVLRLHVLNVALARIEVVLIFTTVVSSVILLHDLGLLIEELRLLVFVFILLLLHKLATAQESTPDALTFTRRSLDTVILPFQFKHVPSLLDDHCSCVLTVAILLS